MLGRRIADEFVAGAVALGHPDLVGLSNVFSHTNDPGADYAAAAEAALACFPDRPTADTKAIRRWGTHGRRVSA